LEVGEFPSFLKKGKCDDCSKISLDKKEKDLVLAERLMELDGKKQEEDFVYKCFLHSRFILTEPRNSEGTIKINNPQDLESIREELRKYA